MEKRKIASIEIYNNDMYIMPVLHFLDTITMKHQNLDYHRYHQLQFVVGKVLATRIQRAYPGSVGTLTVELFLTDTYFEVSIRDKGVPGWHETSYNNENVTTNVHDFNNMILDKYTDGFGIEKLGKDGQRIYIRKNIVNPIQFKKPAPYEKTEALDTNITIRPVVTEQDATEAIRCIYSEYGYSYAYERLYYVDSFMKMVKSGELASFLAVNEHGQTAGHFALVQSDLYPGMPELSTVIVRSEFRGLGLFAKFMEHSEAYAKEHHFRAIMGQPVTFHPMSQKAFLKAGYTATALLSSYLGTTIESEYNEKKERLGLSASVRIIDEAATSKVYVPSEIEPLIQKIYDRLGWQYEILRDASPAENTVMAVENSEQLQMTRITLSETAEDAKVTLKDAIKNVIKQKNEMIELMIPMTSPSSPYGYELAKSCGFLLSGVIPGGEKGDYLVMQMLPGDDMSHENLVTVGEFEELRQEIASLAVKHMNEVSL